MKKAIFTLALAAFAFAANAQFVLGGSLGFNHNGGNQNTDPSSALILADYAQNARTNFNISPKFGYNINDKMQLGLALGINYNYNRTYGVLQLNSSNNNYEDYGSNTQWSYDIAPYFRYNITDFGKFTLFCEAQLAFGITPKSSIYDNDNGGSNPTNTKGNTSSFGIDLTVVPGLNYKLSDCCSLDLYVDLAGCYYSYNSNKVETSTLTTTVTTTNTTHDYGFTANANAQTLGAHLGNFRLGFNYHF